MTSVLLFCVILVCIYCIIVWIIIPKSLAWYCESKYKIVLRVGRIGLLRLCDVNLSKNGYTIHIDEASIRSSFFNSEVTKLVTLVARDVRVNKDIGYNSNAFQSDAFDKQILGLQKNADFDFRNKKIPHSITTFAQFMAIHVYNISVMLLRPETPGLLVHATAEELHVDGSIVQNARTLLVNVTLTDAKAKVLRHAEVKEGEQTVLGELCFGIALEATLAAQGPLAVEKLHITMSHTTAVISDGFYGFVQESNVTSHNKQFRSRNKSSIYLQIAPIVPKNFVLKIDDTSLRSVRNNSRTDFNATLKNLTINSRFNCANVVTNQTLPEIWFAYKMTELIVQSNREKLVFLNTFGLNASLESNIVDISIQLKTLQVIYNHLTIQKWVHSNFLQNRMLRRSIPKRDIINNNGWFDKIVSSCIIQGDAELSHISALVKLDDGQNNVACCGLDNVKFNMKQSLETRGITYENYLAKLLLSDRHWQTDLQVQSVWWSLSKDEPDTNGLKKTHCWGTPIYLGLGIIKMGSHGSVETKIESLFEIVNLELSPLLAVFVSLALKCLEEYDIKLFKANSSTDQTTTKKDKSKLIISCTIKYINCFFLAGHNICLVSRLNLLKLENQKNIQKMSVTAQGLKITSLLSKSPTYKCLPAESVDNYCAYVKKAEFEYETRRPLTYSKIQLKEEVSVHWSTNLHLRFLTLVEEFRRFVADVKTNHGISGVKPKDTRINNVSLRLTGNVFLDIKISSKHCAKVSVDDMTISYLDKNLGILNNTGIVAIDNADIFTVQGLNLHRIHDSAVIRQERLDNEEFRNPWNKTWGFTVNLFKASFPYKHDFAEAFQNQFVSVFKWLKIVHKKKKIPFTADSPLPSDLFINIKEFLFEMSDDPFEVKLRDNYILLEDEFKENLKRKKMLHDKVQEMCKTRLHLPQGKVEELYANLNKKNAEIYVQRSKQWADTAPPRTRLFAWLMTDVEIMVLADSSIHGTDNCVRIMREIDPESLWPEDGLDFSTLWCRVVSLRCKEWKFQLRDFPQPLLDIRQMYVGGQLVGAEQIAPRRARRDVVVELDDPWGSVVIQRGMTSLKFYHDFNCDIDFYSYAFGPCWEPVIEQCNLSFEKISSPSRDPSPRLCFWDKMRLLWHGRLTMVVQQLTVLLHASLDPYNTTEEMELTWNQLVMDWTNAKFVYKGDLNIFVRTASKYDDCQLLHIPNLKLTVKLHWLCLANPNDHHSVIQCAPDKIPEYSINQEHDSFRAFRSQHVNIGIALETKPAANQSPTNIDCPMLMLYGSTLRWFENLKLILSGVTRPTRRGTIFKNVRPRKLQLSRHYKKVHLSMGLHKFQVCYWMSFAMQRGCELHGGRLSSSSEHSLAIIPIDDGLKHRPKTEWSIIYMNSDLNNSEIWLKSALQGDPDKEPMSLRQPVEKCYCLSVAKVSYGRETVLSTRDHSTSDKSMQGSRDTPTHRLVVYDLRGAWTKSNRNVAFALFDTFMKNKQVKKNLSTDALKSFRKENSTPLKRRNTDVPGTPPNPSTSTIQPMQSSSGVQDAPSPLSKLQSGHAATMLQQLIAEAENKAVVFSDDLSSATRQQHLQGLQACQEDDVQHKNWLIALVNAQVLLKGCETKGYVILSAAKAEILQRVHRPVWKERTLVSKTTWVGSLESLQYFATVSEGETDSLDENIMWLKVENIQENNSTVISDIPDVPDLVGSGQSVGGVVSETVGASSMGENCSIQLQRIVSRCKCEFFYAGYGDISVDPDVVGEMPPPPQEEVVSWDRRQTAVDAFTLMHYDLDVCTNSLQYAMLLDIVNNLLLYVEPRRKEALERLARMRFQLQLHSVEDQRRPIQNVQNQVRSTLSKLRRLEKESYFMYRTLVEDPNNLKLTKEMEDIENLVYQCKEHLNLQTEELDMMLSCFKETQLSVTSRLATTRNDKPLTIVRANEICFKHAQWRLTEADGQLGIADLVLSNFLYTKNSKNDDSVEHLLELGYVRMTNLIPNQIYKEVLCPTEIQSNMPVEHKRVVRVFCREKPPVGGISVKEHFEINVVPLTIGLTKKFYNKMLSFCFPERDPDNIEGETSEDIDLDSRGKKIRSSGKKSKETNFYVRIDHKDDIEKMKERAEKNKLFIYIKIPEVPVRVSYKGNKEKNIEDIRDFSLVIPTLEYHNVTWTWLDLLLAIKSDSRRVILPQAIKQKLQINRNKGLTDESSSPQEEDKARILFGAKHATENRSLKKGVSGVFKFSK